MTIEKAIEMLTKISKCCDLALDLKEENAISLSIEALKFYRDWRISPGAPAMHRLPGETKE